MPVSKWNIAAILAVGMAGCTVTPILPPPGDSDQLLPAGRACTAGWECQSGHCISLPAGDACAALCAGTCPAGQVCKRADGRDPTSAAICVPAQSRLCQTCTEDSDCGPFGDLCLTEDLGTFCALDCSETQTCPEGFACTSIRNNSGQELSRQCVPESGTCTCGPANDGLHRPCDKTTAGVGKCFGEETCLPGSGWVDCDARTPQIETCDHQDNDCDGEVDEDEDGAPLVRPCSYGPTPPRRECLGVETCVNGIYSTCSVPAPPAEELYCDGLDDDCDGEVDDGLLNGVNACGACDNVCPPGPAGDETTLRSCSEWDGDFYCDYIGCYVPHFDVNGSEEDGCEVTDDHDDWFGEPELNDQWDASFQLGRDDLECLNGENFEPDETDWYVSSCDLKIPDDYRQHHPDDPPWPNVDYHHFLAKDTFIPGPLCEPDTWICAFFAEGPTGYEGVEVEVCGSLAIDDLVTEPTFPTEICSGPPEVGEEFTDCCWRLELSDTNWISIPLPTNHETYFYVRVRTLGAPYDGTYALAAYDWTWALDGGGYEACPLGVAGDPCSY